MLNSLIEHVFLRRIVMNIKRTSLFILIAGLLIFSGCGIHVEFQTPTTEPVAPPIEGDDVAPPVEVSAEEIRLAKLTPSGVLVFSMDDQLLTLVDPQGTEITTVSLPDIGGSDPRNLHLAGSWAQGQPLPPVIYQAFQPDQAIRLSSGATLIQLPQLDGMVGIAGAAGQPAFAFSRFSYEGGFPISRLHSGTPDSITDAPAFYESQDSQMGMVLMPVAVEAAGNQPQGVWYAQTAWGIGGVDLIYPINRGLYYYDLTTGENRMALNLDRNFQGISPDRKLAASVPFDGGGNKAMAVHDLETGMTTELALNPSTDRGAGYAVFSPDSRYVSWLEASGSLTGDPEFQPRIRVGDTADVSTLAEMDKIAAAQAAGWEWVSWMKPVGFLNNQTVLVEARGENWATVAVLAFDIASNSMSLFHAGSFSGFAYP
jgi:hypothetical protein